jgi:hypothetical protein
MPVDAINRLVVRMNEKTEKQNQAMKAAQRKR